MANKVCPAVVAFLCAVLVLQVDYIRSSEDLISSLGHEFDLAALKLLQSYDDEEKKQSSKDRISVMNEGGDSKSPIIDLCIESSCMEIFCLVNAYDSQCVFIF